MMKQDLKQQMFSFETYTANESGDQPADQSIPTANPADGVTDEGGELQITPHIEAARRLLSAARSAADDGHPESRQVCEVKP